ncbi:multiple sugar transport system permease protein [Allocatelliglobosispora scoriae]|uniref:Multiple sugar transport system permease protein n=1 Tax=Allocatelliglobosispora scoriae TaxID=643052 RepID=A0A841BU61_9ACTN|nr:carbohydrate ABC transporter permease [Allocatelliglobosispora scoriae]MBB5870310.1 multiple sugar transport system permease protein [Allocatelliglobosispora scoriae]
MGRPTAVSRVRGVIGAIVLIAILAVVLYPLIWLLGGSFKSPTEVVSNMSLLPTEPTLGNYPDGWSYIQGVPFGTFFVNSMVISLLSVVANGVSCLVTAYAFARLRFFGRKVFFALMIGTLLLPGHVLIIPQYVMFNEFGWVDTPLPLVIPKLLATEAFFVFLMVQFMRGIPRELDDAAKIDGCDPYRTFRHVILPLSRPALITTAIFSFIWTWNDFFTQLVYLPSVEKYTVPIALRLFIDSSGQTSLGPMMAMSVLALMPVFLFFLAFQRFLVEGINTSGLKG